MDIKEFSLISEYHQKLASLQFDELDVLAMLILLRPHSQPGSKLREAADFVAHRQRTRGKIHTYLNRARDQILKARSRESYRLVIREQLFTEPALIDSINKALGVHGLNPVSKEVGSAFMLCVISLLQGVNLYMQGQSIASLRFATHFADQVGVCLIGEIPIPLVGKPGERSLATRRAENVVHPG